MKRLTYLAIVLAAVVGVLLWMAFREVPVVAGLAEVSRGSMKVTVDVDGKTRIREVYEVATPITGTALRSPVRVGDPVVGGETVVARVRPATPSLLDARSRGQAEASVREAEAALNVAEGQVHEAEETLVHAESTFERSRALVERGVASLTRLEDDAQRLSIARASLEVARSSRDVATGALERARAALIQPGAEAAGNGACCIELTAPVTGRVLSVAAISERPVQAGALLVSIGSPDDLEIVAEPLSRDAVTIPEGALAEVERWGGPVPLEARLRQVSPSAHEVVSTLGIEEQRVEALFDILTPEAERGGLGDGYSVYLRVVVWQGEDVLQVTLGALFREGEDWAVFRIEDGRARLTPIEIGQRNATHAEVTAGLAEGDRVIAHPSDTVADGVAIEPAVAE